MLNKTTIAIIASIISFGSMATEDNREELANKFYNNDFEVQFFTQENEISPRIVNGGNVSISDYPYYARLITPVNNSYFYHNCGGSILNKNYILTAAHCVFERNPEDLGIVINKDSNSFSSSNIKYVSDIYIHPDYNNVTFNNDIAILKLNNSITENFTPISIPSENEVEYYNTLSEFDVIGFGQTNTDNDNPVGSSKLKRATVKSISDETCIYDTNKNPSQIICAKAKNGSDSCYGDSGGPLIYNGTGKTRQAGLVSYSVGSAVCGGDNYTVYTEISGFSDWIQQISGKERDENGENVTDPNNLYNPPIDNSSSNNVDNNNSSGSDDSSSSGGGSFGIFSILFLSVLFIRRFIK